jgi:serine/threonine protein phosphatase PrpC
MIGFDRDSEPYDVDRDGGVRGAAATAAPPLPGTSGTDVAGDTDNAGDTDGPGDTETTEGTGSSTGGRHAEEAATDDADVDTSQDGPRERYAEPADGPAPTARPDPGPESPPTRDWYRTDGGRWVVGDQGRQDRIVPRASTSVGVDRPDTVIGGGRLGALTFRGASVRGHSHREHGTPRQDAFTVSSHRDGEWLVGCVADGVSAGKRSHEAADAAVEAVWETLAKHPVEGEILPWTGSIWPWQEASDAARGRIVEKARASLERRAQARQQRQAEEDTMPATAVPTEASLPHSIIELAQVMSTTAIAFAVHSRRSEYGFAFATAVLAGDSAAALLSAGTWAPWTSVKNEGAEVAESGVRPLPLRTLPVVGSGFLQPGECLAVYTDGIGDPLGSGQGTVGRFLAEKWSGPPDTIEFAQQVDFLRKSYTDDRTVVAVWTDR